MPSDKSPVRASIERIRANTPIQTRIFLVIIAAAITIVVSGLAVGAFVLTRSIRTALEDNLLVAVDIADQYIIKELEILKLRAADAARDIGIIYAIDETSDFPDDIGMNHSQVFKGFALFDADGLYDSWGEACVSEDLIDEPFIQAAFSGERVVSTTFRCPCDVLVKYVAVPLSERFVLAAVLPGHYISSLATQFTWWETGHLFLNDEHGNIISNIRPEWVESRINFVELAKADDSFSEIGSTMARILTGERGNAVFSVNGVPRMSAFRPLSSVSEQWNIGVIAPIPEGPLNDIPRNVMLMGGIMMILSIAAALIAATVLRRSYVEAENLRKVAEVASLSKSTFLANMSHEIRTPMNAIIGMTTVAISADNTERKNYALSRIRDASKHLLGIINDILDMSKIEADKLELHPGSFVLEELLQRIVYLNKFRIIEKYQKLAIYIDENIPRDLICDDQRLAQIITNLLSNAVKFTPEYGRISLRVSQLEDCGDSCVIRFDLTDTGVGINEEQKGRLFMAFEQAESSTTRNYGGTGLGLAITKRIVELMEGNISVTSAPGQGSTFSFTIRAEKPSGATLPDRTISEEIHILIVEGDEEIRDYLCSIAKRFNVQYDTASNCDEVMQLLDSKNVYDICFVDQGIPGADGVELSRSIKERGAAQRIVLMTSSFLWQEIESGVKDSAIDDFLAMPVFPSAFLECIESYLRHEEVGERHDSESDRTDIFRGYRMLLVEDVEINREIALALFEPTLLEIDCAENGAEAIRMFEAAPDRYHLILMDVQMPEMDGYNATRAIRASNAERAKTIPIIALTANVFREDVDACVEAGMNGHLGKPFDFDAVTEVLRKYLLDQEPLSMSEIIKSRSTTDRRQTPERRMNDRRKNAS